MHYGARLVGHDKLDTTAHYTRVATGMISGIASPLDDLDPAKKKRGKRRPRNEDEGEPVA